GISRGEAVAGWRPPDAIHSERSQEPAEASMAGIGQEFKAFVMRGNVVDLAVGVVIGAAFGRIVTSLVGDVIMPPIGLVLGGVDFAQLAWVLKPPGGAKPAPLLGTATFTQPTPHFLFAPSAL